MTRNENKRKRAQIEAKRSKGAYHTMGISNVIALLSGVALFLFGMTLMGDGLKKVAGNKLELVLYKLSGNPIKVSPPSSSPLRPPLSWSWALSTPA